MNNLGEDTAVLLTVITVRLGTIKMPSKQSSGHNTRELEQ